MVVGFRLSPDRKDTSSFSSSSSGHVRSTSLPSPSHPLFSRIHHTIQSLHQWHSQYHSSNASPALLRAGLTYLDLLLVDLDDLLQLPQTQLSLRRRRSSAWAETLLEDFLLFADAYGSFREAVGDLLQAHIDAEGAVRRREDQFLTGAAKARRKAEKELLRLSSSMRQMGTTKARHLVDPQGEAASAAELVGLLREVRVSISSVSAAVFVGLAAFSESTSVGSSSSLSSWGALRKRLQAAGPAGGSPMKEEEWEMISMEGLKEVEDCVVSLEMGGEKVFRSLLNARVSLLNVLAP